MSIPVINTADKNTIDHAMNLGNPFYIDNGTRKLLVYDPQLRTAANAIINALERAENCKTTMTEEEFWSKADKL